MLIVYYILGIIVSALILLFTISLENKQKKEKLLKKIRTAKSEIPIIQHWDEESMLTLFQQRFFLASIMTLGILTFVLFEYLI